MKKLLLLLLMIPPISIAEDKAIDWRIEAQSQAAGTPNQAGIGTFIPLGSEGFYFDGIADIILWEKSYPNLLGSERILSPPPSYNNNNHSRGLVKYRGAVMERSTVWPNLKITSLAHYWSK